MASQSRSGFGRGQLIDILEAARRETVSVPGGRSEESSDRVLQSQPGVYSPLRENGYHSSNNDHRGTQQFYRKDGNYGNNNGYNDGRGDGRPQNDKPRTCFNCGQSGHTNRNCPASPKPRNNGVPDELVDGFSKSLVFTRKPDHSGGTDYNPRNGSGDFSRPGQDAGARSKGCYKCGDDGHTSGDCPQQSQSRDNPSAGGGAPRSCFNCGSADHMSRECTEPRKERGNRDNGGGTPRGCYNCGKDGHSSRDCTEPRKQRSNGGDSGMSRACFNCGKDGHQSRDCPEPRKERENRDSRSCFNCGKDGHQSRDCPEPRKERENRDSRSCFNCGKDGHQSRDCPEPKKERESKGCFNCGVDGHQSRECPEPKKERDNGGASGACFRCKKEGHMSKDCTETIIGEDGKPKPPPYIPPPPPDTEEEIFSTITQGINFCRYDEIKVECTGRNAPAHSMESFAEAKFSDVIMNNLRKTKYEKPTPIQKWAVPVIASGRDMMGVAQTGSGKTASFLLPILNKMLGDNFEPPCVEEDCALPLMLILAPTRELVLQIFHETRKFSFDTVVRAVVAYGGVSVGHQKREVLKGAHVVIATPGRFLDFIRNKIINLSKLRYLVLDEADRMLDMGFNNDISSILSQAESGMPPASHRQTVLFSATIPEEVQKLAAKLLREDYLFITVGCVGSANLDIEQFVWKVDQAEKRDKLLRIIQERGEDKVIVFVEQKRSADFISAFLSQGSFPTASIHGDLSQMERERALRDFRFGRSPILVATNVAARGLDIPEVKHVVNYDMPSHIEEYVHRIGRTGRCGNIGKATSFFVPECDAHLTRALVKVLTDAMQEVPEWLDAMAVDSIGMGGGFQRSGPGGRFGGRDFRRGGPNQSRQNDNRDGAGNDNSSDNYPAARNSIAPQAPVRPPAAAANDDTEWD
uniref:RNA helicase n=1 Tax=Enchytraeus coronatus TaxID=208440 RepID=A0AAU7VH08_9ANNE